MSLENKGNVVIDLKSKSGLKEDDKKKIIENGVTVENLDSFSFDKFDEAIEKSFQNFLKTITINSHDSKETIQMQFNDWLDDKCKELDIMKDTEIDEKIIKPVSFELVKEATRTELEDLQKELLEADKKKTEVSVSLNVGKDELRGLEKTYNGIKAEDIAVLFSQNFEGREHLLDLLKNKESRNDNIRKFQRIVAGIDETNSSKDKDPETLKKLGGTGVDGFFGKYTLEAFKKYVSDKKIVGENPVKTEVTGENPGNVEVDGKKPGEDDVVVSASASVTGTATQEPVRGNPVTPKGDSAPTPQPSVSVSEDGGEAFDYMNASEISVDQARDLVQKEKGKEAINLSGLKTLKKEVAKELAKFAGELILTGLDSIDEDVLNEFKGGKCTKVHFAKGVLEKDDDGIKITITDGGAIYDSINSKVCALLLGKSISSVTTGKPTTTPTGSGSSATQATGKRSGSQTTKGQGSKVEQTSSTIKPEDEYMGIGRREQPDGYILLSELLSEELRKVNDDKDTFIKELPSYLKDIPDNKKWSNSQRDDMIKLLKAHFNTSATIKYNNSEMSINDFCNELKNGKVDTNGKDAKIVWSDYIAYDVDSNGNKTFRPVIKSVEFVDKTESQESILVAPEENDRRVEEQRAKPKFGRILGELSHGKKEVDDVMKLFTSGGTVTYKNENMPAKTFLGKVKSKEIKIDELNNLALNITLDPNSTADNLLIQSVNFSDNKADGRESTTQTGGTNPAIESILVPSETVPQGYMTYSDLTDKQKKKFEKNMKKTPNDFLRSLTKVGFGDMGASELENYYFVPGSTIIYKNEKMSVSDFVNKIKEDAKLKKEKKEPLNLNIGQISWSNLVSEKSKTSPRISEVSVFDVDEEKQEHMRDTNYDGIQIVYDADTLISGLKKGREAKNDMDALKLLLGLRVLGISDEISYSIEGYELKGQEKKDLKGIKKALKLFANGHETNVTIEDFFKLAAEQYALGEDFDLSKLEPSQNKKGGTNDKYKEFGKLYAKYRRQEGGPYFKKIMGVMEDYFLRGTVNEKSITDLYNMMNVGTWEGYIDTDKQKEVFKGLFDGKDVGIDLGVPYQSSEQLKTLKKIVKKIGFENLNELFASGKLDGKGNNLGKWEKQFYDLYQSYKKGELQGDNYYKKVFDFLVSSGRGNTNIVNLINATNLLREAKVDFDDGDDGDAEEAGGDKGKKETKDKIHYNSEEEKKFILLLSDFNLNGRVDGNDSGLKMGQQIRNIYKSANIDLNNHGLDDQIEAGGQIWRNVVDYAKQYFNNISNPDMAKKFDGIESVADLNQKMKEDPTILIALQNMLKNSSISINSIFRYGDKASEMFMKELMQDEKMDEQFDKIFEGWVNQGVVKNDPTVKQALKPIVLGSLMDNSVGIGLGAAYDAGKIGNFSAVLGVSDVPGMGETVGLVVGYGNSIPLGDKVTIDLGASGGASYSQGFVPMFSVYAGTSVRVSDGAMRKNFDVTKMTKIHAGANFTMIGTIPSWGLSAGVSMDKLGGIDKQESMLRPQITSVISEFLDDAEITGIVFGSNEINDEKKEKCISNIREKLSAKYGKMDEDLLDKAANNLYMGFAYYAAETDFANMSEQNQKLIKDKIINNIVNNYVTQWRNDKIEELNGTTAVSDVTVGVQFLAGYYPIPMIGVTFTKYSNLYSRETPESIAEYESVLSTGQGMGYLERSVDEDGNVLRAAIKYLNDKMSVASRYNLEKMQIQFREITDDGAKNVIFIPRELCNSVNISMDPEMEKFVRSTPEGFEIPVNSQLSLLTYTRTDTTKFNLIIGDYKRESGDIDLNIKSEFKGNPLEHKIEGGNMVVTKHKINEDMSDLFDISDFPLGECKQVKDNKFYFDIKSSPIQCIGNDVKIEDGKLVVPCTANLVITKTVDGEYTAKCDSFIKGFDTHVVYVDEKKNIESQIDVDTPHDLSNLFESYEGLNSMFGDIEKRLSKLDDNQIGNYASFMDYASDMADGILDENDYNKAFDKLRVMLSKLSKKDLNDTGLSNLKQKIDSGDLSNDEKMMIVDRFKMLFSYHIDLSNGQKDGEYLATTLVKRRKNVYETLKGYDGTKIPDSLHGFRDRIVEKLKGQDTLEKQPLPNLIGMTAFYRLGNGHQGRGYSMTEMGKTTVLGGVYEELPDNDSKERFISNLDKSNIHKETLISTLSGNIKALLGDENMKPINGDELKELLRGNYIDIGDKKVKIDVTYMFYLLGECGNESIGVKLNKIIVREKKGGDAGITEATISPDVTYEGVSGVYTGSAEAMSRYEIGNSNSATLGFAVGKGKQTETEEVIGKDHTEPGENQDPSNNQTEVNENIDPNNNEGGGINLGGESNDQIQIEHEQNNGGLIGHGPGNNGETGSFFGREPRLDPNGGGINLGGEMPTLTPGTYKFTDNLGNHVVTITETEDSYIVHTVTTPLPQHGHALTASQSETHSETKVVKKEK